MKDAGLGGERAQEDGAVMGGAVGWDRGRGIRVARSKGQREGTGSSSF